VSGRAAPRSASARQGCPARLALRKPNRDGEIHAIYCPNNPERNILSLARLEIPGGFEPKETPPRGNESKVVLPID
jgi:hypothetical protein